LPARYGKHLNSEHVQPISHGNVATEGGHEARRDLRARIDR
jgi:hypothetical protein